jgi:hypothetical protein
VPASRSAHASAGRSRRRIAICAASARQRSRSRFDDTPSCVAQPLTGLQSALHAVSCRWAACRARARGVTAAARSCPPWPRTRAGAPVAASTRSLLHPPACATRLAHAPLVLALPRHVERLLAALVERDEQAVGMRRRERARRRRQQRGQHARAALVAEAERQAGGVGLLEAGGVRHGEDAGCGERRRRVRQARCAATAAAGARRLHTAELARNTASALQAPRSEL